MPHQLAETLGVTIVVLTAPELSISSRRGRLELIAGESLDQLDRLAERLNRAGSEYRAKGVTFAYHKHHVDFTPIAGEIPFGYLVERTDPDLVKLELDIGWMAVGGVNPVDYLTRYSNRVVSCHLKDFDPKVSVPEDLTFLEFAALAIPEPGAGTLDFAPFLEAMKDARVGHASFEFDASDGDPLAATARANKFLGSLATC